jgi:outer membrane protein assembly factor BamB
MPGSRSPALAAAAALSTLLAATSLSAQTPAAKVDGTFVRDNEATSREWPTIGLDYAETRFSKLKRIDASNVKDLGLAWSYNLESTRGVEATPLVVDGLMYVTASWSIVHAIDARTGKARWVYDPKVPREIGFKGCCDVVNRGVALHRGKVYVAAYDGRLIALDAGTGKVVWSRNVATHTGRRIPDWGFASSPLIIDDVVIVAAAGTLAGYDLATGNPRWRGPSYGGSYSSPHRATLDGVLQVVLLGGPGVISVDPATGTVLWKHEWSPGPIIQPALTEDGDILVNAIVATGGVGTRRLHVTRGSAGWNVEERWTSTGLKPYFNDFVVHGDHAFGFDNSILASINLKDGARNWKGGRYGNGQLMLLADQDVLLVISEEGEVALVGATIDGYKELARFRALDGKTWNHPALVGDVLLVRNGEEMAAFRLPRATSSTTSP